MTDRATNTKPAIRIDAPADTAERFLAQLLDATDVTVGGSMIDAINNSLNIAGETLTAATNELGEPPGERTCTDSTLLHLVWSARLQIECAKTLANLEHRHNGRPVGPA